VTWFDYKFSRWFTRSFIVADSFEKMAIIFDAKGNLCAAYVNQESELRLASLNFETNTWQDDFITTIDGNCLATALTFDRDGRPVIVAGNILVYYNSEVLPGDANCDGTVDVGDLGILAANYGTTNCVTWNSGDFSGDGAVDVGDLGILAAHYGEGTANLSSSDFNIEFARAFGTIVENDNTQVESFTDEQTSGFTCSNLGLPLISSLFFLSLRFLRIEV
jgi:hypothetical protein